MTTTSDFGIIGAGIVGLATALNIRKMLPDVSITIFEKEIDVAKHQTGHNSGVIHSGVYYKPGSLKAKTCFEGYRLMLNFLNEHHLPYDLCGKVIVASTDNEIQGLNEIHRKGIANGLSGLEILDEKGLKQIEPYTAGVAAIKVPQAGITDYKLVAAKMRELLEHSNVKFKMNTRISNLERTPNHVVVKTDTSEQYQLGHLVSCAGLFSDRIAKMSGQSIDYQIVPFRGEYYDLLPEAYHLVKGLIYPVPDPDFPFLGVHFTKTIHGGVESGPNAVFAFKREGYAKSDINVSELVESITYPGFLRLAAKHWRAGTMEMHRSYSKSAYLRSLQKLIPSIENNHIRRGGAGVRAQALKKDGSMVDDFLILQTEKITNVCNAPSPAATASLAIGKHIAELAVKTETRL